MDCKAWLQIAGVTEDTVNACLAVAAAVPDNRKGDQSYCLARWEAAADIAKLKG